jgi:outer membrane protein assembly factor BamA
MLLFCCTTGFAQDNRIDSANSQSHNDSSNTYPQKDVVDYFRLWLGFKSNSRKQNFRPGDKPVISVIPAVGYTLQTRLAAIISGNIAFFTDTLPDTKVSVVVSSATYTQNKQFFIPVLSNIWLSHNRINLIGDLRYMKYPQSTFGLGSDAPMTNEDPMDYQYLKFHQYVLRAITHDFSAGIGYNLDYRWDISEAGLPGGEESDYAKYGTSEKSTSSGLAAALSYDSRNNPINASRGFMANVIFRDNFTWLGSDANWQSMVIDMRKYFSLSRNNRAILGFWSYNWLIFGGKPPFLDLPSTAWDSFNNTGRGFIQGRFRGDKMIYLESELRLTLTRNGLLGAVFFGNAQSFSSWFDKKLESIQPGYGLGLRIKLNKKSNTNIAIDYGFGTQGSKGLSVNIGEVF